MRAWLRLNILAAMVLLPLMAFAASDRGELQSLAVRVEAAYGADTVYEVVGKGRELVISRVVAS